MLATVNDLDGDGTLDVILRKDKYEVETGCCTNPSSSTTYEPYLRQEDALVPYKQLPTLSFPSTVAALEDFDKDGRLDFWSLLGYQIPGLCADQPGKRPTPAFLLHHRADGTLSRDNAVAQAAARSWCPKPPTPQVEKLPGAELASYVLCARLWGQSAAELRLNLARRCRFAPGELLADGRVAYGDCYRLGEECLKAGVDLVCGDWINALVDVEPPFHLR
jgi:hypothetical protein